MIKIGAEALLEDIKKYPDAYNYEQAKRLNVSTSGIYCAIKRLGISYKKTLNHPKASKEKRQIFEEDINME
jgi:transposase